MRMLDKISWMQMLDILDENVKYAICDVRDSICEC